MHIKRITKEDFLHKILRSILRKYVCIVTVSSDSCMLRATRDELLQYESFKQSIIITANFISYLYYITKVWKMDKFRSCKTSGCYIILPIIFSVSTKKLKDCLKNRIYLVGPRVNTLQNHVFLYFLRLWYFFIVAIKHH